MPSSTKKKAPMRRKRAAPLNQTKIAAAALDLIREDGAEALSMRRIAERLGVDVAAPYRHFSNKEDLLRAAGHLAADAVDLPEPRDGSWKEQFVELCTAIRTRLRQHPELNSFGGGSTGATPFNVKAFGLITGVLFEAGLRGDELHFATQHTLDTLTAIAQDEILRRSASPADNQRFHKTIMEHLPERVRAEFPPRRGRSSTGLFNEYFQYATEALLDGIVARLDAAPTKRKRQTTARNPR